MAKSKSSFDPIKTGSDPRKDAGRQSWLKIDANSHADVAILVEVDEIIAVEQCAIWLDDGQSPVWVYTGPEDPSHDLKVEKRYRAYLPVLVDGESRVWSMGKQAHSTLLDIADAQASIKGLDIRIKRTGAGLATRYSIVPRGTRKDVSSVNEVDVVEMLGPITSEGVKDMLCEKFSKDSYEDFLTAFRGKGKTAGKGTDTRTGARKEEDEIEDLDKVRL
jgi:hypothetical protein